MELVLIFLLLTDIALCSTGRLRVLIRVAAWQGFLLGLLTSRRANIGNIVAMFASAATAGLMLYLSETGRLNVGWSWMIVIGTVMTFSLGWLLGPVFEKEKPAGL